MPDIPSSSSASGHSSGGAGAPSLTADAEGLEKLGWLPDAPTAPQVSGEVISSTEWTIARMWSAGAALEAPAHSRGCQRVMMSVAGHARITVGDRQVALRKHQLAVFNADQPLRISSTSPWARYEWLLPSPLLSLRDLRGVHHSPFEIHDVHWQMIATITNTVIRSASEGDLPALHTMSNTLNHVVVGALTDVVAPAATAPADQSSLLERARALIRQNFADPSYDVRALQADLLVSRTHLHRIFSRHGTTPRRELEVARLDAVTALLGAAEPTPSALIEAAAAAGFRSTEGLRRALARRRDDRGEVTATAS